MRFLLPLLAFFLIAAATPQVEVGPLQLCSEGVCSQAELHSIPIRGREALVVRNVTIGTDALPMNRPLMVRVIAMASSEVRWNGVIIGRNGLPGQNAASERPGRFIASFIVPNSLLRSGRNIVQVRLSAHHLWLPVQVPVHAVDVVPYQSEDLPDLTYYLPALIALGALAAVFVYFLAAWLSDRKQRLQRVLAVAAGAALLQLLVEVSRAFLPYLYPWHLARIGAVAVLAAVTGLSLADYAARRFAPEWRAPVLTAAAGLVAMSLLLVPGYDFKALGAILVAIAVSGACALHGLKHDRQAAGLALAACIGTAGILAWQLSDFLDSTWFFIVALVLVVLVMEQIQGARRTRNERDAEAARAAGLAERLVYAERRGEPIAILKDGSRTHRVVEGDILYLRAADDYCEVVLGDGRILLATTTLAHLLTGLTPAFMRVHKSYAANRTHIAGTAPKLGGGRELRLANGVTLPIGRSYSVAVLDLLAADMVRA